MPTEEHPSSEALRLARILDAYHRLNHTPAPADCIIGLGTNDPRVGERAADLYLEGLAPRLVFTGGVSGWTQGLYQTSEAQAFAQAALKKGVPQEAILMEEKATHTGENIRCSKALLQSRNLPCRRLILVQKPYMERRTYATCKRVWPEPEIQVTSPRLTFEDYPLPWLPMSEVIHILVGDLHRIMVYPRLGFQIEQPIPETVSSAFAQLVRLGYNKHLVPEPSAP